MCVKLDKYEHGVLFKDKGYVIRQWNGEPYHPQAWKCKWQRFTDATGLTHIRFHDLRHSHCTALIEQGVDMKTVQYRMAKQLDCVCERQQTRECSSLSVALLCLIITIDNTIKR